MKAIVFSNAYLGNFLWSGCRTEADVVSFFPISLQELFRLDQLASQPPGSQELTMRTNLSSNLRDPSVSASQMRGFSGWPHQTLLLSSVGGRKAANVNVGLYCAYWRSEEH